MLWRALTRTKHAASLVFFARAIFSNASEVTLTLADSEQRNRVTRLQMFAYEQSFKREIIIHFFQGINDHSCHRATRDIQQNRGRS